MALRFYEILRTLINMVLSIVTFFLIVRVVLKFFSTNPSTPFVAWIFRISDYLITPFAGIVPNLNTPTGVLDIVALITLLAYLVLGYIVLNMIQGVAETAEVLEDDHRTVGHYHDVRPTRKHHYTQKREEEYDL